MFKSLLLRMAIILIASLSYSIVANAQNCSVNAGINKTICPGSPFVLTGNATIRAAQYPFPSGGEPKWTQIAGPSVQVGTPTYTGTKVTSVVTGAIKGTKYKFRLSAQCADGSFVFQDVEYTLSDISDANAGPDAVACPGVFTMQANPLLPGEIGEWVKIGPEDGMPNIKDRYNPNAKIVLPASEEVMTATYRWIITKGECEVSDDVVITNLGVQTVNAGPDQALGCYGDFNSTQLHGSFAGKHSATQQLGTWTVVSGPTIPVFSDVNKHDATVGNLREGTYVLKWTVKVGNATVGANCPPSGSDTMTITVPPPTKSITHAGHAYHNYCDGRTTVALNGVKPVYANETVNWTLASVSGGAVAGNVNIVNASNYATSASGLSGVPGHTYDFRYTITNSVTGCTSSGIYTVNYLAAPGIQIASSPVILACNARSAIVNYTTQGGTNTSFALISAPSMQVGGATIKSDLEATYFQGLNKYVPAIESGEDINRFNIPGTYILRYKRWTQEQDNQQYFGCSEAYADVTIIVSKSPSGANAGTRQILGCDGKSTSLIGNEPLMGTGSWSQVSGPSVAVFVDKMAYNTEVKDLKAGSYVFRWIISAGAGNCADTQSDVQVDVASAALSQAVVTLPANTCAKVPFKLMANVPNPNEKGTWTISSLSPLSPNIKFSDIHDPFATVENLEENTSYTFTWTISNACTDEDIMAVSTDSKTVLVGNTPGVQEAKAGTDQCLALGTTQLTLSGNQPAVGESGKWTIFEQPPSATQLAITNDDIYNTTVTGLVTGKYVFKWTLTGTCGTSTDEVSVNVSAPVSLATAALNDPNAACAASGVNSLTLKGNVPAAGESGSWTQISGPGGVTIVDPTLYNTQITGLIPAQYVFRWTISNGACGSSSADVKVNFSEKPSIANAGGDQDLVCDASSTILAAIPPLVGTGKWMFVSGPKAPTFSNLFSATATISDLIVGTYVLKWVVSGSIYCAETSDEVTIKVNESANVGALKKLEYCGVSSITLVGNAGSNGDWSSPSLPPSMTIDNNSGNTALVSNLTPGIYKFRYTIAATGQCGTTFDELEVVIKGDPSQAKAGADQHLCSTAALLSNGIPFNISANAAIAGEIGKWTLLNPSNHTIAPIIANSNAEITTITIKEPGVYLLQWTLTVDGCNGSNSNNDVMKITVSQAVDQPVAGADKVECDLNFNLNATQPGFGIGKWTMVSSSTNGLATIQEVNNPNTSVLVDKAGVYKFKWEVSDGLLNDCASKFAEVNITVTDKQPIAKITQKPVVPVCMVAGETAVALKVQAPTAGETGTWSISPNQGSVTGTAADYVFKTTQAGDYTLTWKVENGSCVATEEIKIKVLPIIPKPALVTANPLLICLYNEVFIQAAALPTGTEGRWLVVNSSGTAVSSPISFENATLPQTKVYGLELGTYYFRYEVYSAGSDNACNKVSTDVLRVDVTAPPTPSNAGLFLQTCNNSGVKLHGNKPTLGTGKWTVTSTHAPGVYSFSNDTHEDAIFTATVDGEYKLKWTITNGNCISESETEVWVGPVKDNIIEIQQKTPVCANDYITLFSNEKPTGGNGIYAYAWESNDGSGWVAVPNSFNRGLTFKVVNTTNANITYQFKRIVSSGGCSTVESNIVDVVVKPLIVNEIKTNSAVEFCNTSPHDIIFENAKPVSGGNNLNYTYQWQSRIGNSAAYTDIAGATNVSYTAPQNVFKNTGITPVEYQFRRVVSSDGCTVESAPVKVIVNPTPVIKDLTRTVCSGVNFSLLISGLNITDNIIPTNTTYAITPIVDPNIKTHLYQDGQLLKGNFVNPTNAPVDIIYTITPTAYGCTGGPFTLTIRVNPVPEMDNHQAVMPVCSGTTFTYNPTGNLIPVGTEYSWATPTLPNGLTGAKAGTNATNFQQTLTNSSNAILEAVYQVSAKVPGSACTDTFEVKFKVFPKAKLDLAAVPKQICNGATFAYTAVSPTVNADPSTFTWTLNALPQGVTSNGPTSGTGNIPSTSFANTSATVQTVTYTYNMVVNGCAAVQQTLSFNVLPNVKISAAPTITVVSEGVGEITLNSNVAETNYTWTNDRPEIGLAANGIVTAPNSKITFTAVNTGFTDLIAVVKIRPTVGACTGDEITVVLVVKPKPKNANYTLTKRADLTQITQAGNKVTYTIEVSNPTVADALPIHNIVVSDPMLLDLTRVAGDVNNNNILDVGETWRYTGTYTVPQSVIDHNGNTFPADGKLHNTVTLKGETPDGKLMPVKEASVEIPIVASSGMGLSKTSAITQITHAGQDVPYRITLSNSGKTAIRDVVLDDPMLSNLRRTSGDLNNNDILDFAEIWIYEGSYVVKQADIDANGNVVPANGKLYNQVTVKGKNPKGQPITVQADHNIDINASVSMQILKSTPRQSVSRAGDVIPYDITVSNNGNSAITNLLVNDPLLPVLTLYSGDLNNNNILDVSETWTYKGTYVVKQTDIDNFGFPTAGNGKIINQANATGTSYKLINLPLLYSPFVEVPILLNSAYTLEKSSTTILADKAGQVIPYVLTLRNTGITSLKDVQVIDPMFANLIGPIKGGVPIPANSVFAAGDVWTYTGEYVVTQTDLDKHGYPLAGSGKIANTATANANNLDGTALPTLTASKNIPLASHSYIQLSKKSTTSMITQVGQAVDYVIEVQNTGLVALHDVVVKDPMLPALGGPFIGNLPVPANTVLGVGETWTYKGSYVVKQTDIDNNGNTALPGMLHNKVTVEGKNPDNSPIGIHEAVLNIPIKGSSSFELKKTADKTQITAALEVVHYTITVKNTGTTVLNQVDLKDPLIGTLSGPFIGNTNTPAVGNLQVGQTWIYTGQYTVPQLVIDNDGNVLINNGSIQQKGVLYNIASVEAKKPDGSSTGTANDFLAIPINVHGDFKVSKTSNSNVVQHAGQQLTYSIKVQNTGVVALSNIDVQDPMLNNLRLVSGDLNNNRVLDVKEIWIYQGDYTVKQQDIDLQGNDPAKPGILTNKVTVSAQQPNKPLIIKDDVLDLPIDVSASFLVTKSSTTTSITHVGQVVPYQILVSNRGVAAVTHIVVTDPLLPVITLKSGDANNNQKLDVSETWVYEGAYTIKQSDLDNNGNDITVPGIFRNTVSVVGKKPDGSPTGPLTSTQDIPVIQILDLKFTKVVIGNVGNKAGEKVKYELKVSNTGSVTLLNLNVTDPIATIISGLPIATLAPGASATLIAEHTITQAEVDQGFVENQALVKATDKDGKKVDKVSDDPATSTPDDPTIVQIIPEGQISLVKTAALSSDGNTIVYTFTVRNVGKITLSDIKITDVKISGPIVVTPSVLQPGATATATAVYTISEMEKTTGLVRNTAVVTGKTPKGSEVKDVSGTDENNDTPTDLRLPNLSAVKSVVDANNNGQADAAEHLRYTIRIANDGHVDRTGVDIRDAIPAHTTYVAGTATPNATLAANILVWTNLTVPANGFLELQYTLQVVNVIPDGVNLIANKALVKDPAKPSKDIEATANIPTEGKLHVLKKVSDIKGNRDARAQANEILSYEIAVANVGGSELKGIRVNDVIPVGTTYMNNSVSEGGLYDNATGQLVWSFNLQPKEEKILNFDVKAQADVSAFKEVLNTVMAVDAKNRTVSAQANIPVDFSADLEIRKVRLSGPSVEVGQLIKFKIEIENKGQNRASKVQVVDELSRLLDKPLDLKVSKGAASYDIGTKRLTWLLDELALNEKAELTFDVKAVAEGDLLNTATVKAAEPDPNTANNTSTSELTGIGGGLYIPNLYTPNGDGRNDTFEIRGLEAYAENELIIVNRWGNEVFKSKQYKHNWTGDGLSEGTYYYKLMVKKTPSSEAKVYTGYISLIRAFKN